MFPVCNVVTEGLRAYVSCFKLNGGSRPCKEKTMPVSADVLSSQVRQQLRGGLEPLKNLPHPEVQVCIAVILAELDRQDQAA